MKVLVLATLFAASACQHDAKPAQVASGDQPLPPSSGTPIGYLIDDASELKLQDDQLSKLKQIDATLSARIDVIDSQLKTKNQSADPSPDPQPSQGGRHRGGGGRGGMGGRGDRTHPVHPPTTAAGKNDEIARLTAERAADVRDALHQAFDVFDPTQQAVAKKVLADHGVDLDTNAQVVPAEGSASQPQVEGEP